MLAAVAVSANNKPVKSGIPELYLVVTVTVAAPLGPGRTSEHTCPKAFVPVIVKLTPVKLVPPSPVIVTNNPTPASAKLDAVPARVISPAPPNVCAAAIESSSADVVA